MFKLSYKIIKKLLGYKKFCSAVIVAAGSSQRMNGEDKLFFEVNGKPVLGHTLTAFQDSDCISEIIVVTREETIVSVAKLCELYNINKVSCIILGGLTRQESVFNGVTAVSKKASLIAIHDAARPCVDDTVIHRAVNMAAKYKAAAPAIPITSTVKRVKNNKILETVDRGDLVQIQTPQVFDAELIKYALNIAIKEGKTITDDCMAVEVMGACVYTSEGSANNIKLTTKEDIPLIEAILSRREQS